MRNLPIVLTKMETLELVKIGLAQESTLTSAQWQLLARLVGSVLMSLRHEFVEQDYACGAEISVKAVTGLIPHEELAEGVPFLNYRI